MDRISTTNKSVDLFGVGKHGWKNRNVGTGIEPTEFNAEWCNGVQEELLSIIEAAGLVPATAARTQVRDAIATLSPSAVGSARNVQMSIAAASASGTLTADEIVVATALGGRAYKLASFNKTCNLATVGANGMDTGAAPASGYVAVYAIYNPTTGVSALLATNATAAVQPNVYGGANMPAGYTASALVSVWPTNVSSQFLQGFQVDRFVSTNNTQAVTTSVQQSSPAPLAIAVPLNARRISGNMQVSSTLSSLMNIGVYPTAVAFGTQGNLTSTSGSGGSSMPFNGLPILTPQTLYYIATSSAGTPTFNIFVAAYEF